MSHSINLNEAFTGLFNPVFFSSVVISAVVAIAVTMAIYRNPKPIDREEDTVGHNIA